MVVILEKFMLEELGTLLEKDAVEQEIYMHQLTSPWPKASSVPFKIIQ